MRIYLALMCLILSCVHVSASDDYRLQSGDTISVSVWQEPKLDRQVMVRPDGVISFPLVGHIRAAGKTLPRFERELSKRLQGKYTADLDVTVSLVSVDKGSSESIVFMTGEVNKPGPFELTRRTNVMQAIAIAGGFATFAATSRVQVHRQVNGENVIIAFDYDDFTSGRDVAGNVTLQAGDVVVVPEKGLFE